MFARDNAYYGILNDGLSSIGYEGATSFNEYVNDTFAAKYNAAATFGQMGFSINPNLPINPTFEQLELVVRPYTMGAYVDIDSDGPTKHTDGAALQMGTLPTFKHEVGMDRKTMREQAMLRERLGNVSDGAINETIVALMFNSVDKLLGGNYNTIAYQRHQIVSTGKLVIDATNNPTGVPYYVDFLAGRYADHKYNTTPFYKMNSDGVTVEDTTHSAKFLTTLRNVRRTAETRDHAPKGHWEVAQTTWDRILQMPALRSLYTTYTFPTADADARALYASLATDDVIKAFVEKQIGASIVVQDAKGFVESYNKSTGAIDVAELDAFREGVMVYVPDGNIGDVQFGKPFYMDTPGALTALYDGGRTLLRTLFEPKMMNFVIGSEVTGLCVPNKVRWMYWVKVDQGAANV